MNYVPYRFDGEEILFDDRLTDDVPEPFVLMIDTRLAFDGEPYRIADARQDDVGGDRHKDARV
jgi:hypothetical protein